MTVSDLTGTTWLIDETPDVSANLYQDINFNSQNASYVAFECYGNGIRYYTSASTMTIPYKTSSGWRVQANRTIEITGGTDATSASLIAWLESNATQVIPKYPNKVVYNGTTLIDLTSDTVTAGDVAYGVTAHDASGAVVTGTIVNGDPLAYGSGSYLVGTARIGTGYVWTTFSGEVCIANKSEVGEAYAV